MARIHICRKHWTHIENASKYAAHLRRRGYDARAFTLAPKFHKVEYRR